MPATSCGSQCGGVVRSPCRLWSTFFLRTPSRLASHPPSSSMLCCGGMWHQYWINLLCAHQQNHSLYENIRKICAAQKKLRIHFCGFLSGRHALLMLLLLLVLLLLLLLGVAIVDIVLSCEIVSDHHHHPNQPAAPSPISPPASHLVSSRPLPDNIIIKHKGQIKYNCCCYYYYCCCCLLLLLWPYVWRTIRKL